MKRLILMLLCGCVLISLQFVVNCSRPLESIDEIDTLFPVSETPGDTVVRVDTVTIVEGNDGSSFRFCARLASNQQEIVWLLQNEAGQFHLEFAALADRIHPSQTLLIEIDGEQFQWQPAKNMDFVIEQELGENAIARISSSTPHSFGHAIDVCLKVKAA